MLDGTGPELAPADGGMGERRGQEMRSNQMNSDTQPDLVLRGGHVYTVDAARSWAQAVAVRSPDGGAARRPCGRLRAGSPRRSR